jgi:hypothetical protein
MRIDNTQLYKVVFQFTTFEAEQGKYARMQRPVEVQPRLKVRGKIFRDLGKVKFFYSVFYSVELEDRTVSSHRDVLPMLPVLHLKGRKRFCPTQQAGLYESTNDLHFCVLSSRILLT